MWHHSLRRTLSSVTDPARRAAASRKRPGRKLRLDHLEDRAVPANLIELTGVTITHDETAGLQIGGAAVPGEDNNDSDVALSNLATMPFSSRLFGAPTAGLGLNPATAIGVARSAGNVITLDGSQGIFDVAFTDAAGDPLNGNATGLATNAGNGIFLYTDTENNIALGREGTGAVANPSGAVVFAAVLGETKTAAVLSGAELWVVQFQPIKNPDATNPDDPVDLNDKLFVKASAELLFDDFSKAPSGQNDWLGFGPTASTADVQILTTGKTPLEAENNQAGDTVNTSTIGLGSNQQSVTPGEGIRIDFVSGLNLPPQGGGTGDTKDMFGINYAAHVDVTGASYKIVQVQGNPNNRVSTLATITNTDDEEGADFVDPGLTNDVAVNVSLVQVLNAAGVVVESRDLNGTIINDPNVTITITGNTALVTGLLVNYSVLVRSASGAPYNRILVENVGIHNFDLGTFKLVDAKNQVAEVGDKVRFEDGGPVLTIGAGEVPTLTVDETNLAANAGANFAAKFGAEFGPDGSGAAGVTYALATPGGASGLIDTATGQAVMLSVNGGVVEGRTATSNDLVFTITIDASANVTLDQKRAVVHPDATNPDDSVTLALDDLVTLTAAATDADGDTDPKSESIGLSFVFKDDGPAISASAVGAPALTVDETALGTDASGGFAAQFTPTFGADGAGATPVAYALGTPGGPSGLTDTETGQAVVLSVDAGVVEGRTQGSNALVFTVSVDGSGNVTLDQKRAIFHADATNPDDSRSLSAALLVTLTATATDKDADAASAVLNIGQLLNFKDDGPSVSLTANPAPSLTVDETALASDASGSFAGQFSHAFGADGAGAAGLAYNLSIGAGSTGLTDTATGQTVVLSVNAGVVEGRAGAAGPLVFTVSVDGSGNVTLDQKRAVVHPDATNPNDSVTLADAGLVNLTATATDKDADTAAAALGIAQLLNFADDGPQNIAPTATVLINAPGQAGTNALDFLAHVGADKAGSVVFSGTNGTVLQGSVGGAPLANLTSGNATIYLFGFGTGTLIATTSPTNADLSARVFTIALNPAGDSYTVTMLKKIDNGESLVFNDFSGVPSGQQQWIGLNDPRPAGQNQDQDVLFTGRVPVVDTVNTSQTGLGSNNQSVNPSEAIRTDFVTGLNVVGGDFKFLSTMTHGDYYSVDNAGFLISQTQSGATVTVRVRAFDETTPTVMEANKVADLTDDPADTIDLIKVVNAAGATLFLGTPVVNGPSLTQGGITVSLKSVANGAVPGGTDRYADVSGLLAGMRVIVSTVDGGFHRVVAENVGQKGFDLGGVVLEQSTPPEPVVMSFPLTVKDGDLDAASGSIGVTLNPPPNLMAASAGAGSAAPLTRAQVQAIRAEAFRRWNLTGLTAAERRLLRQVRFQLADLNGLTLGTTIGRTITLDRDAAGNGWFVDRTPRRDTEFTTPGDQGEQGRIDLLTAVMHEMGHVLGRGHDDGGVMADSLGTGVRLNPVASI